MTPALMSMMQRLMAGETLTCEFKDTTDLVAKLWLNHGTLLYSYKNSIRGGIWSVPRFFHEAQLGWLLNFAKSLEPPQPSSTEPISEDRYIEL